MPSENEIPISQKLRELADWFDDYNEWRETYQSIVDSGGNPGGGSPPPPPPGGGFENGGG